MLNSTAKCGLLSLAAAVFSIAAAFHPATASAQASDKSELEELAAIRAAAEENGDEPPPSRFSFLRPFNTSLTTMAQHNSTSGWTTILFSGVAWRPNRYLSVDATVPAYTFLNIYTNIGTAAKPVYAYQPQRGGAWGDAIVNIEGDALLHGYSYSGIFSLGLPSGNTAFGIGAGQVTYSFNNWFQRPIGRFTTSLALGYGDTSNLTNRGVLRNYVAVGPVAHFQAGSSLALTRSISFNAAAYEELPLATDVVYSTTGKGRKSVTTSANKDPTEDNGFVTSLAVPLSSRLGISGFYSRSLRDHTDIAGFAFTLTARPHRE